MESGKKQANQPADASRRRFLSSTGLIVGSTALLGACGLAITGCGISGKTGSCSSSAKTVTIDNVEYLGECICPRCGAITPHPKGVPCRLVSCPECEGAMARHV